MMKCCTTFVSILTAILGFSKRSECEYRFESLSLAITGCEGGTSDLNWRYMPQSPEPLTITWTKRNPDGSPLATLASTTSGVITVDPAYTGRVTRVGNGNIKLNGTVANDEGQYRIDVFDISDSKTTTASGFITFYIPPAGTLSLTSSGSDTIVVGDLTSKGTPQVSVQCQDQNGNKVVDKVPPYSETLPSPVANGMYTCRVTGGSVDCLDPDDILRKDVSLYIDGSCTGPVLTAILIVAVVAILLVLVAVFVVFMKTKLLDKIEFIFIVIGAIVVVVGVACTAVVLVLCQNIITPMIKATVAMSIICLLIGFFIFVVAIIRFVMKKM